MNNFNYGENLRITRQIRGVSQESMAWNLNISQATYSRIESEKIKIGLAFALANVACDAASGACDGLGTSANTKLFMSWIAAVAIIACFYYWGGRVRKMV